MSDDLVFETKDDKRYAPSVNATVDAGVDLEFARELSQIPNQMYFKIGDVAKIVDVKPYVLRYWESEFAILSPSKSKHNQRAYSRKDVETVLMIKKLLYKDRFSIEGARAAIKNLKKETKKANTISDAVNHFEAIRDQLHDLISDIQGIKKDIL